MGAVPVGAAGEEPRCGRVGDTAGARRSPPCASPASLRVAVKQEGLRFVEQELENITVSDLHGQEGQFHYNISQ